MVANSTSLYTFQPTVYHVTQVRSLPAMSPLGEDSRSARPHHLLLGARWSRCASSRAQPPGHSLPRSCSIVIASHDYFGCRAARQPPGSVERRGCFIHCSFAESTHFSTVNQSMTVVCVRQIGTDLQAFFYTTVRPVDGILPKSQVKTTTTSLRADCTRCCLWSFFNRSDFRSVRFS